MALNERFRRLTQVVAVACAMLLVPGDALLVAQEPPPAPPAQLLPPDQLDSLVAPVALYPDALLSQILVASTYPLELVEAGQWLARNPGLNGPALTQGAQQQNWDPSIQALVIFPDLIQRLTQDITWTTNLGNAFLAQQGDVMDAVQRMRARAEQAGKLSSTPQQQVIQTTDAGRPVIEIEPVNPAVIYIPEYDPALIWGPPVFFGYPHWWYPHPGVALVGGAFFGFGVGISIGAFFGGGWHGWGGWGWRPGWGNRTVIVNNNFIHQYNFNSAHVTNIHGATVWNHDAFHRQGVPYPNRTLTNQYRAPVQNNIAARPAPTGGFRGAPAANAGFRGNAPAPNSGFRGNAPAPNAGFRNAPTPNRGNPAPQAPAANSERFGSRQIPQNQPARGAFSGIENGAAARVHSDHGYASLGPSRTAAVAPRSAPAPRSAAAPRESGGRHR